MADKDVLMIQTDLRNLVGPQAVSECPGVLRNKLGLPGSDLLLVEPGSEEEAAAVLKYANEHRLSVIPAGNGQQLHIGETPRAADIVLSAGKLTGIVEHSVGDLTVTVRAGTPFSEVQKLLRQKGQFVPVMPPTSADSTIGGLVAAAAGGPERVLYGSWRDLVIGMRVVYPNGQIIRCGGKVVKNVAGYDMNKLFVGSYGTLAFITEITLKLRPYPKHRELVIAESGNLTELIDLAANVLASECVPSALELIRSRAGAAEPYRLAIGCDEVESAARYQADRIRQFAAGAGADIRFHTLVNDGTDHFWADYRDYWRITPTRSLTARAGFPITRMAELLPAYEQEAFSRGIQLDYAAGLGVGTLRLRLQSDDSQALGETVPVLRQLAENAGGYLVVEHAEPDLKKDLDVWGAIRGGLSLMKGIKQTVDPAGILNPGRYVGGI